MQSETQWRIIHARCRPAKWQPATARRLLLYNSRFAFGNIAVTAPLFESTITSLPLLNKGKVRDIYAVDADKLLIITTDRLSAFDVILPDPIPRKGEVLQAVASFWFERLGHIVPNQLTGIDPESVVADNERDQVRGRAVVVKRLKPLPIEALDALLQNPTAGMLVLS